jgi:hypothetical protein
MYFSTGIIVASATVYPESHLISSDVPNKILYEFVKPRASYMSPPSYRPGTDISER